MPDTLVLFYVVPLLATSVRELAHYSKVLVFLAVFTYDSAFRVQVLLLSFLIPGCRLAGRVKSLDKHPVKLSICHIVCEGFSPDES